MAFILPGSIGAQWDADGSVFQMPCHVCDSAPHHASALGSQMRLSGSPVGALKRSGILDINVGVIGPMTVTIVSPFRRRVDT